MLKVLKVFIGFQRAQLLEFLFRKRWFKLHLFGLDLRWVDFIGSCRHLLVSVSPIFLLLFA